MHKIIPTSHFIIMRLALQAPASALRDVRWRNYAMNLIRFIILSLAIFALNVACGADHSTPRPGISTQEKSEKDNDGWPGTPSGPMTCLRIAYDHYVAMGDNPRNAWNNATTACRKGMEPT